MYDIIKLVSLCVNQMISRTKPNIFNKKFDVAGWFFWFNKQIGIKLYLDEGNITP